MVQCRITVIFLYYYNAIVLYSSALYNCTVMLKGDPKPPRFTTLSARRVQNPVFTEVLERGGSKTPCFDEAFRSDLHFTRFPGGSKTPLPTMCSGRGLKVKNRLA